MPPLNITQLSGVCSEPVRQHGPASGRSAGLRSAPAHAGRLLPTAEDGPAQSAGHKPASAGQP